MPIDYRRIVDTASDTYMKHTTTPGMSVALVDGQNQQFFNYGFIDTQQSAPVTENTIFGIGSVTKVFTSILLQDAVNNGKMTSGGNSHRLAAKDGKSGLGGYEAWVGIIPKRGMGVALLSNKSVESSPAPNTIGTTGRSILHNILDAANGT